MKHGGKRTAQELLSDLETDPQFIERQRQAAAHRERSEERYAEQARGLLEDLESAGYKVRTVAELQQPGVGGPGALPALLDWLPRIEYPLLKQDVATTLGSSWARPGAAPALVHEFDRLTGDDPSIVHSRWAIGGALERVADESVVDDIVRIAADTSLGSARGQMVVALGNMRGARDRVLSILIDLLDDPDVVGYAVMGLSKLKAPEARSALEQLRGHSEPWVRQEVKRALAKLPEY